MTFEKFQRLLITLLCAISFFYGGYYMGKRGYLFEILSHPIEVKIVNQNPNDQSIDFGLFWDVWKLINSEYLERPVDPKKMLYGAVEGMVRALGDPHTAFLTPQLNDEFGESLNGEYEGIGAQLGLEEGAIIVISPFDGSPAKAAGLRPRDRILAIDGQPTSSGTLTDAVAKIRGKQGSSVTLTIQTGTDAPRDVSILRGAITVPSVSWEDKGDGTAYIRVSRFGDSTNADWAKSVSEINLKMDQLDAVIVDVRSNPGGYLNSAVYLAEEFMSDVPVLFRHTALGEDIPIKATRTGTLTKVPAIYVLIDEGSASASEILAAALKDNKSATLIGKKSYGKGTIQESKEFSDGSSLHLTIEKWLTPKKEWVHGKGLQPDVEVDLYPEGSKDNTQDLQLDKALELAKKL